MTGFDRQAVSDAFLVDPDLRGMDKFDDKVERLQRIMKAKRELVKLGQEIAKTQGKRKVGGQNKEQIVTPLRLAATKQSKLHVDIELLKMGVLFDEIDKQPERLTDSEVQNAILQDCHRHVAPGIVGLAAAAAALRDDPHEEDPDGCARDGEDEDAGEDEEDSGSPDPGPASSPAPAPSAANTPLRPSHEAAGSTTAPGCNRNKTRHKRYTVPPAEAKEMDNMRKKMLTFSGSGREWEQQYRGWPSMTIPASINRTGAYETRHHASMDKHYRL